MSEKSLTIFLLTHNRPKDAWLAVTSILQQKDNRFKLIVSDNSELDDMGLQLQSLPTRVEYRKRPSNLTAFEHFNLCISEVTTDFYALFHDDDLMLPNFVGAFWRAHEIFPNAIAYGGNALIERGSQVCGQSFLAFDSYQVLTTFSDLAAKYFSRHQLGISPFPSYVYRRFDSQALEFDLCSGKYGDVQWLLKLIQLGKLVWSSEPVMIYRLHGENDSNTESFRDRMRFLGFLKGIQKEVVGLSLVSYRRFLYRKFLAGRFKASNAKRQELIEKYLVYSQWNPSYIKDNFRLLRIKISTKIKLAIYHQGKP